MENERETKSIFLSVGQADDGDRLDVFLARRFRRNRSLVQRRLRACLFDRNGSALKWSHRVRQGESVRVESIARPEPAVRVTYRILYQDDWLVAVDKGAGAPVHPTRSYRTRTVWNRLREELKDSSLSPAHRLDRETSGVLVFGRGAKAVRALMKMFREGGMRKRYLAVVRGRPHFDRLRVRQPLGADPDFPIACRIRVDREHGRPAITDFEVLERFGESCLLAAVPATGRQHQIRVHLAHLGHPVLGDKLYQQQGRPYLAMVRGELDDRTLGLLGHTRQALHAESLEFVHPFGRNELRLTAPLPEDLRALVSPGAHLAPCFQ